MKSLLPTSSKQPIKFRIPAAENLVPIRLDIEIDGHRFKDAFSWNTSDPDSEVFMFAKRTVKDLKLPPTFISQIVHSIQAQLTEFRSYEGQEMYGGERLVPIKLDLRVNKTVIRDQILWDLNNFESDPEEFARTFCTDLEIEDPEIGMDIDIFQTYVGCGGLLAYMPLRGEGMCARKCACVARGKTGLQPAIAVAIREQLYEIAIQNVASARETRISKKGRRAAEFVTASKSGGTALDLVKLFGSKASIIRKRKEWDLYEPIVDILSAEEAEALDAREERNARLKKKLDDKDDGYITRFTRS